MKLPIKLHRSAFLAATALLVAATASTFGQGAGQTPAAQPAASAAPRAPAWVARSNQHAKTLLTVMARLSPEGAGQIGVDGYDEAITDFSPGYEERAKAAMREAAARLSLVLASEGDPQVKQDLQIMLDNAKDAVTGIELSQKYSVTYVNVSQAMFGGLRALLDDQVAPERRKAALVRLRKYAGVEPGTTPFAVLAEQAVRARMAKPGLQFPPKAQVERGLADSASFVEGIPKLFEKYKLEGFQEAADKLKAQITAYDDFVRKEVLPKARTDFRQPPELYAFGLRQFGVDIPPGELAKMAHAAFDQIQKEMQTLAPVVAKEKGLSVTDYRDVIRELKKDQLVGDAILPHYQSRLKDLEQIITREKLVTLPTRPARIRLATAAETAQSPAPNMRPPRLVGNTGEQGEFVLPLNVPSTDGKTLKTDDFTFSAASWTLTAHEARPGHEMQFAAIIEAGVSTARALFSFNSTNVEGWGLYAERVVQPFMPAEGKLISLQHRLMRAARAYLDPELQAGTITPDQAFKILTTDVVLSEAMARQEVDRYTFRAPGQATSYFYGYTRLVELRTDVEKTMGAAFDQQAFHDFVLAQGLLPPALMREAVTARFIKK
jgi:uncharacterized protein (DUF885 family)